MDFKTIFLFLFLPFVILVNWALPARFRHLFLLAVSLSCLGYFALESLYAVLFFSAFNFFLAKGIAKHRMLFSIGITVNCLAILLFNYFSLSNNGLNFFISTINFNINSFIIALGLSFYSLQNISYLIEVYAGRMKAELSLSKYVLYASFFPKIISGPILFPKDFFPQINKVEITKGQLISGFQIILIGLFKKMVIADRLTQSVSSIFDYHTDYSGITTLAGVYLFTLQLYFDFSGYTDIALGFGKMLGYDLKENFNFPLRATSISEFWRRWHISLISWFTNYIYYPIVYYFRTNTKTAALLGVFITFTVSALWHGTGFTFLAWACCHFIYLSYEVYTKRWRLGLSEKFNGFIYKIVSVVIVFNVVCFSNIFFRSDSMDNAFHIIGNLFSTSTFLPRIWLSDFISPLAVGGHQMDVFNFICSLLITSTFLIYERKIKLISKNEQFNAVFTVIAIVLILIFGIFNSGERFIYMQF